MQRRWLQVAGVGYALRLALLFCSIGSNDVDIWRSHADLILHQGVGAAYATRFYYNHPPLTGWWSALCLWLAPESLAVFSWLIKIPGLLGEALSGAILFRIFSREQKGEQALALYAWSLVSILVSGFHGNTDALVGALCLLCFFFLDKERYFLSGLALAAALNVKVIPLLLAPAALLLIRRPRDAARFVAGGAFAVLPFAPFLWSEPAVVYQRVFAYNSLPDNWGFLALFHAGEIFDPDYTPVLKIIYAHLARYFILLVIVAFAWRTRRTKKTPVYMIGAASLAIFLFFSPGFGAQYMVIPAPLLFAWDLRRGSLYAALAGLFLLAIYLSFGSAPFPAWRATFSGRLHPIPTSLGLVVWFYLGWLVRSAWQLASPQRQSAGIMPM